MQNIKSKWLWVFTLTLTGIGTATGWYNDVQQFFTLKRSVLITVLVFLLWIAIYFFTRKYWVLRAIYPFSALFLAILLSAWIGYPFQNDSTVEQPYTIDNPMPVSVISPDTTTDIPKITPTPPFQRESENEVLIIVAPFYRSDTENITDVNIHGEIKRSIENQLEELEINSVRVEIAETVIEGDDRTTAASLGNQYNATLIVWGADTGVRVEANFLNLKRPDYYGAEVTINEIERTQFRAPDEFAQFVIYDLPAKISFLSLFYIGQSIMWEGERDTAMDVFDEAVTLLEQDGNVTDDFEFPQAFNILGWLHYEEDNYDVAMKHYNRALSIVPDNAIILNRRASTFIALGKYDEALSDIENAIQINPQHEFLFSKRGYVNFLSNEYDSALNDFNEAIDLYYKNTAHKDGDQINADPILAEMFQNRGALQYNLDNYPEAMSDFEKAITLNAENPVTFLYMGITQFKNGDFSDALRDIEHAISLDSNDSRFFEARGDIYFQMEKREQAFVDYSRAIVKNMNVDKFKTLTEKLHYSSTLPTDKIHIDKHGVPDATGHPLLYKKNSTLRFSQDILDDKSEQMILDEAGAYFSSGKWRNAMIYYHYHHESYSKSSKQDFVMSRIIELQEIIIKE